MEQIAEDMKLEDYLAQLEDDEETLDKYMMESIDKEFTYLFNNAK